jgi:hypothetical protein
MYGQKGKRFRNPTTRRTPMHPSEVYIPIVLFISIAAVIIMHLASKHRERLTMIEKGMASEDIKALYARGQIRMSPLNVLKWGILCAFVGLAVLLGNYLDMRYGLRDGIIIGMVILAAGLGLVVFYAVAAKKEG